jgi:hypothetical protein
MTKRIAVMLQSTLKNGDFQIKETSKILTKTTRYRLFYFGKKSKFFGVSKSKQILCKPHYSTSGFGPLVYAACLAPLVGAGCFVFWQGCCYWVARCWPRPSPPWRETVLIENFRIPQYYYLCIYPVQYYNFSLIIFH